MARKMSEDNVKIMQAKSKVYEQKAVIEAEKNKHAALVAELDKMMAIKKAKGTN